jgi:hypothetical protein
MPNTPNYDDATNGVFRTAARAPVHNLFINFRAKAFRGLSIDFVEEFLSSDLRLAQKSRMLHCRCEHYECNPRMILHSKLRMLRAELRAIG